MNKGTPKTLHEAITNSLKWTSSDDVIKWSTYEIEKHVRDFISQKFSIAIVQAESMNSVDGVSHLHKLFMEIFVEDKK